MTEQDLEGNLTEGIEDQNEELFEHYRVVVDPGQALLRIDKFLLARIPNTSRNKLQLAAKNGNILVNGLAVKPNYKVRPADDISIVLPYPIREIELIAEDIPVDIVWEDDYLAIINKEANMVVHPGYGNYSGTLVNAMMYHFEKLPKGGPNGPTRPGLVHRLDKNTTGIMVIAKTENALVNLSKQFYDRTTINRRYQAIVWGDVKLDEGEIEGYVGRNTRNRKIMAVYDNEEQGKYALTRYKVLKRYGYVTLIECKLETGRTHQIRVHLKSIGHPLFGDMEYGGDKVLKGTTFAKFNQFVKNCFTILPRQALHAKVLDILHPETGEQLKFSSELPADMQEVLDKFERYITPNNV